MKKIIVCAAMLFTLSASAATPAINEKIVKKFKEVFTEAQNIKWYDGTDYYEVSFVEKDILERVYYDLDGNVFRTIRYYDEKKLSPFIALKIKEKYGNKSIEGITELQEDGGLIYQVILKDEKHLYIVDCNDYGDMYLQNKYKNA